VNDYLRFRDRFAEAMDPRFYTIEFLDGLLFQGMAEFMAGDDAAIVVEIKEFPTGARAVCGVIAAGDMNEIVQSLIPQAEAWGKAKGCNLGMIESRPGWARVMKQHGYETFQVSLVKEI